MKVIQRGGPTVAEWKQNITCCYCDSDLEIDAVDLVLCQDEGRTVEAYKVLCPVCGNEVFVDPPITVKYELARKRAAR